MPFRKVLFSKKKRNKILLTEIDYEGISQLLNNGFTLQEVLHVLENAQNHIVFQTINENLISGNKIETFFGDYVPKKYRAYFTSFIQFLSFQDSLQLSIQLVKENESARFAQIKAMFYPILLLTSTILGIFAFNTLCFPSLLSLLRSFHFENDLYDRIHIGINLFCILMLVVFLFAIGFYLYARKNILKVYLWFKSIPIVSQIISNEFIRYFLQCIRLGISTKDTLSILQTITHKPLLVYIAKTMEDAFLQGETFLHAIETSSLDSVLNRFMKIAYYASNVEEMMTSYLTVANLNIRNTTKKLTYLIQIFSYTLIGILLIFIYQVLMLPMNLLTRM